MGRADYRFTGPPEALSKLRSRFLAFSFGFVFLGIVFLAFFSSGVRAGAPVWLVLLVPLAALLFGAIHSFRTIRHRFPEARDPEGYDQKTLPPLPEADAPDAPVRIPVRTRKLQANIHPLVAAIPVAILVVVVLIWSRVGGVLVPGIGAFLAVAWLVVLLKQGRISIGDGELVHIRVDHREIRLPLALLSATSRRAASKDGKKHLAIKWRNIAEWVVEAGGSEDPAVYDIKVRKNGKERTVTVERSLLRGMEYQLLDLARSLGQQPIILKDSADY